MKYVSILLLSIFLNLQSFAQDPVTHVDFMTTDITKTVPFNGEAISIFDISLSMSKKGAVDALNSYNGIMWEFDKFNTPSEDPESKTETRIYVYNKDKATGAKGACILYLIWNKDSEGLDRLVFYNDLLPLAVGDTKKLFGKDAITPGSAFYRRFLVKASKEKKTDYTIVQSYYSKQMDIIQFINSDKPNDVYFSLNRKVASGE